MADIREQGITEIYCLGDLVGYGPNPREVIDEIMKCQLCLLGNHDQGALFDPEGFNSGAERAIFWTRNQLENGPGTPLLRQRRGTSWASCPAAASRETCCSYTGRRGTR